VCVCVGGGRMTGGRCWCVCVRVCACVGVCVGVCLHFSFFHLSLKQMHYVRQQIPSLEADRLPAKCVYVISQRRAFRHCNKWTETDRSGLITGLNAICKLSYLQGIWTLRWGQTRSWIEWRGRPALQWSDISCSTKHRSTVHWTSTQSICGVLLVSSTPLRLKVSLLPFAT
jgi:hypothetical protein